MMRNRVMTRTVAARALAVALIVGICAAIASPFGARGQDNTLVGDYSVAITLEQIPTDLPNAPTLVGQWRISFAPDGTFTASRADVGTLVSGTYSVEGDQVTIVDEGGLLSCVNARATDDPDVDAIEAVYRWEKSGDSVTLTVVEEACGLRRVLLSTSAFTAFVACFTTAFGAAAGQATPSTPAASPATGIEGLLGGLATPAAATPDTSNAAVSAQIDALLSQLTACWATRDPQRVLPLFSQGLRDQLAAQSGSIDLVAQQLAPLMSAPVSWTRAGDLTLEDATHASAVVAIRVLEEETFERLSFVLVDGQWLLDSFA